VFDDRLRPYIEPTLESVGLRLARLGISANAVTVAGLILGLAAIPALAAEAYGFGLALILVNRCLDGVDGAVARRVGPTDLGGYLDILFDFIFYAGAVYGFALARPGNAEAAAFLIFSFVGTATSFLGFAILAAKRGMAAPPERPKAFYHLGGLTEGTETILCLVLMCLMPGWFVPLAYIYGSMCWITTVTRALAARKAFG
jgi:phosphatidylglycerophosphate synthase